MGHGVGQTLRVCRAAWGTGGSHSTEVYKRHPGALLYSCCWRWWWWWLGWWMLLRSVWEHPPFVLFLSSHLFLYLSVSFCFVLHCSSPAPLTHYCVNGWVKQQWAYSTPGTVISKTTFSHVDGVKANFKHMISQMGLTQPSFYYHSEWVQVGVHPVAQ